MNIICPICSQILIQSKNVCSCASGHSFDIARQGYINLLTVQQKHSLHPGDTRQQVQARRDFLSNGYYMPIVEEIIHTAEELHASGPILDIGCGEGYYSSQLADALNAELTGVDISKEAVRFAAAKYKKATWLCATASHLPVEDHCAGLITSLFALTMADEFKRCLCKDGLFFQVLAAEDHLLGLKSIIYPQVKFKEKNTVPELCGFKRIRSSNIRFTFTVEGSQVQNLLAMTPHVHRISKEGANRIMETKRLADTASCVLNVYQVC